MSGATGTVPILMYHEVAGPMDTRSRLAVDPAAFEAQLSYLRAAGFTGITASAAAAALAGRAAVLPDRPVVLTFDDGFADFHATALPLLRRYGFTATVFVTTGWLADAGHTARRRPGPMLTWRQVREMAEAGVEIGAHSHTHPQLDQLPGADLRRELAVSKDLLEDRLQAPVPGLAYPFGYSNARVRDVSREAGFAYACAVGNAVAHPRADLFALPRLTLRRSTGLRTFGQVTHEQRVPVTFAGDHALTKGWAVVRRTRSLLAANSRRS